MTLTRQLTQLESSGLIHLAAAQPDLAYAFRHALVQDAAYASLVRQSRRQLHLAVGEALERMYADRLNELAPLLAHHFAEGGATQRARTYYVLAGHFAARRYANPEALALFDRALELAEAAPPEEVMEIHEARGHIHEFLSEYDPALSCYDTALALARQAGQAQAESRVLARIAWLYWLSGRGAQAIEVAREAEAKARTLDDASVGLRAFMVIGLVAQADGRLFEAYPRMRRCLFASRASRERALEGESLYYLGIEDNFMGRFGRAAACAQKAHVIKQSLGDQVGEMVSLYLQGRAEGGRGCYDAALAALEAGHAVAVETHNPFGLVMYPNQRAWLSAELGDWPAAYELDRAGLELARAAPIRPPEISTLVNLVLDCTALGRLDEAEAYLRELQQWMGRAEFGFHAWRWQIREADARAQLLVARSQLVGAANAVTELLERATRTRSRKYLARGLWFRGHIDLAQGTLDRAEADWIVARDLADSMGHFPTRLRARHALRRLYDDAGQHEIADQLQVEITRLISDLDRDLRQPDLRRSLQRGLAGEMGYR